MNRLLTTAIAIPAAAVLFLIAPAPTADAGGKKVRLSVGFHGHHHFGHRFHHRSYHRAHHRSIYRDYWYPRHRHYYYYRDRKRYKHRPTFRYNSSSLYAQPVRDRYHRWVNPDPVIYRGVDLNSPLPSDLNGEPGDNTEMVLHEELGTDVVRPAQPVELDPAWKAMEAGQYNIALFRFGNKAADNPRSPTPRLGYALASALSGQHRTAVLAFERAERFTPGALDHVDLTHYPNTRAAIRRLAFDAVRPGNRGQDIADLAPHLRKLLR